MSFYRKSTLFIFLAAIFACTAMTNAQSTDQAFPTKVRANEISGTIRARDIGDGRLTTYFYEFGGNQGDIFVNVVTKNFDGDIDIFAADGLRPLSKIVIFADTGTSETGRIVYLRKFERLLLRVQGRTPDDSPATFRIKFAGSFIAASGSSEDEVKAPEIAETTGGDVRVNSVGTIIEKPPSPKPPATLTIDKGKPATTAKTTADKPKAATEKPVKPPTAKVEKAPAEKTETAAKEKPPAKPAKPAASSGDPMASFSLVILFKDGKAIEKPMTDVLRFTVDKGVLTVIWKDGYIARYSMANIQKVSIE